MRKMSEVGAVAAIGLLCERLKASKVALVFRGLLAKKFGERHRLHNMPLGTLTIKKRESSPIEKGAPYQPL
jgi:hypothetical protein